METDQVFCSIIVPVYNTAAYLPQCVDSILAQTLGSFQLLLVDDGSTDGSERLCDDYARRDGRVGVIHQKNGGATSARNAGLAAARGAYVTFVDSDDWIDEGLLQACWQAADRTHAQVLLYGYRRVTGNHTKHRPQTYEAGFYDRQAMEEKLLPRLLVDGRFSLSERMVRRELAVRSQGALCRDILLGEDMVSTVCSVALGQSVYVLSECYYNYRQRQGSLIHTRENYTFSDWLGARECLCMAVGHILPDFQQQLGVCSVRFLQRAAIGQWERAGLQAGRDIRQQLAAKPIAQDLCRAKLPPGKRTLRLKYICLRLGLTFPLWAADRVLSWVRG